MKYHIEHNESYSFASIISPKSPTVAAYITVDIHQASTASNQAAQAIYSDALLSGNARHSRAEFLNAINMLGATIGVSIGNGVLNITLKARTENFAKLLKLTDEMLTAPAFTKEELVRIKSTVTNELHEAKEDSKSASFSGLLNSIYGHSDRKYTYEIDETITKIKSVTTKDLKKLHQLVISQLWTCSIAAEPVSSTNFEKLIKKLKKNTNSVQVEGIHQQKPPKPGVKLKEIASRTNVDFSIGAPLPITLHHPDYIPLSLGLAVLGKCGGFSGRLMSTVRELEGLTYGIYSRLEGFTGTEQGYWRIMTFFAPDKAMQGLESTIREVTLLFEKGITEEELERFKTIVSTQQTLLNDSVAGLLSELHTYHCHGFTLAEMKEHKARISTLTLKEVNKAIKIYLDPTLLTISGAGPVNSVQTEIKDLIKSVQ